uniref:GMP synthase (glutamine-hydrolyzing) n=1 Tax=uncultured delta proteobacterium HF0770_45N15 TaxID=710835 RepID=E0XZ08_9DELT|nr:GMP synthase, pp-ATPase domain/subunit [uncultured delta proteobacterium HF0770_45N15]
MLIETTHFILDLARTQMPRDFIIVLDFGSQYAHLIAKRLRHLGFYTEIHAPATDRTALGNVRGLVLSGGPASVFAEEAPAFNPDLLNLDVPILGLCYGHQLVAREFGGVIENTGTGEFGKTRLHAVAESPLWEGVTFPSQVWMSHQDSVTECPPEFQAIAETTPGQLTALQHQQRPVFTLQFHPEVTDSEGGTTMLGNFARLCKVRSRWSMETFIAETTLRIQEEVGDRKVLMFLSGGVDSSVAFALLVKALGTERVHGLCIDNGFMRKHESEQIMACYRKLGYTNVEARDYSATFLTAVSGMTDPQAKRAAVGAAFIQMHDRFLQELDLRPEEWMLGQGTLYPDIIESGGTEHANVIKSHHNRVQEVVDLMASGQVVEPLKDLYKDEVRQVGKLLDLPETLVWRHPFPGPGLSINVLCTNGNKEFPEQTATAKAVRTCLNDPEARANVLPVRSVGVQGDQRTYTPPAVLWNTPRDWDWLEDTSIRITNTVRSVNRVVLALDRQGGLAPEVQALDFLIREAYCTKDRLDLLRDADALATQALERNGLMREIFQLLVILLPISRNGKGDSVVLRPVVSEDVMTAQFARLDWNLLDSLTTELLELPGVDTVFYDVSHKPPATFGWE